ncbi:tetratricopeptide repeat protein [Metabacillus fastidiosus]|uniref:tetratricopeptide repeat protein n=1 Tax=Metabacillus fastidiosus TaxID=1458 RepID=UPI002DBE161E|nr:tetratricopeptide repeat protein [Metabacillus fastidiosus]MEC2075950.1 tetratricopeptide repeat protein [Metabacillus fastidiosus]
MDNYYEILNLDMELEGEALKKELNKVQKKWIARQNAPDLNRRQEAERILNIVQQAEQILLDESKRKEYNEQLLHREMNKPLIENSTEENPEGLLAQAWDLLRENRYADAIVVARQATSIQESDPNAWKTLGYAYYMWNDYEPAINCYKEAINIAPNNSGYYYDLSNIYLDHPDMIQTDKLAKAKELNRKALHINPEEDSYQLQSAVIDRFMEDFDQAIATLEYLLTQNNNNPSYRAELAYSYYYKALNFLFFNEHEGLYYVINKEDGEKALNCFEKALSYADNEDDIVEIQHWINIINQSFEKKFDYPGFKAFVIPLLGLLIGLLSSAVWLILVSIGLSVWIYYANYVPVWKMNKVLLQQ